MSQSVEDTTLGELSRRVEKENREKENREKEAYRRSVGELTEGVMEKVRGALPQPLSPSHEFRDTTSLSGCDFCGRVREHWIHEVKR